jgi:predicted PurR-regulated permease PerM
MAKQNKIPTVRLTVSNRTVIRFLLMVLAFGLGIGFIYATRSVLVLIVIAFFLALALNAPVTALSERIKSKKPRRGLATAAVFLVVVAIIGFIGYSIVPPLVEQTNEFIENAPQYVEDLQNGEGVLSDLSRRLNLEEKAKEAQADLANNLPLVGGPITSAFTKITSSIASVVTVLVLTFFMLVEGPSWIKKFWELQPRSKEKHRKDLAARMYRVVVGYVNGQLIIAALNGVVSFTIMKIFGLPYALPLACLAAVLALIPLIGATLGAVVIVAVALFDSVATAIIIAIFYVVYQQIENTTIQPFVQSKSVEMSPLLILLAAIVGVSLAGFLGALLAIPVAACLRILVNDLIEQRHLRHAEN